MSRLISRLITRLIYRLTSWLTFRRTYRLAPRRTYRLTPKCISVGMVMRVAVSMVMGRGMVVGMVVAGLAVGMAGLAVGMAGLAATSMRVFMAVTWEEQQILQRVTIS